MKKVFLYVSGGDYGAITFEERYEPQKVYEQMVQDGITSQVLDSDDYMEVKIMEFGDIDDEFISFVKNSLCDYDQLKGSDIFEVKPII